MFGILNGSVSKFILTFFFYRSTEQHNKDKARYSIGDRDEYGSTVWLIALDFTSKEHRVAMRPLGSCPFSSLNLYLWNCFRHLKGLSRWHYNIWMELRVFRRHSVLFSPRPQSRHPRRIRRIVHAEQLRSHSELEKFFDPPSFIQRGAVTFVKYFTEASRQQLPRLELGRWYSQVK